MPDFRISDTAPEHPKLRAAGLTAAGLWGLAGAWSMKELTDGWVPEYWVTTWASGKRHAAVLVKVGLWRPETRHALPGYRFHDWLDTQRSVAQLEDERAQARERARRSRQRSEKRTPHGAGDRAPNVHDSLTLTLTHTPDGDIRSGVPDPAARDRAPSPSGSAGDAAAAVRQRLQSMTRSIITDEHAAAVVAQILAGASGPIRSPARYVLGAIDRDPDPRRFLPTPTPPPFRADAR